MRGLFENLARISLQPMSTHNLMLTADGPKHQWTLTPASKPGRIDVAPGRVVDAGDELTTVTGQPAPLVLALWGRMTVAEAGLRIDGTADLTSLLRA